MPLPIVHNPVYIADLPPGHRFPMDKFGALARLLHDEGHVPEGFQIPGEAPASWLGSAHDRGYVDKVLALSLEPRIVRQIGLPLTRDVVRRARTASAGTLLTARLALDAGLAANTAGGSHHARHAEGAGFCVFNDVAVAASVLLAEGSVSRVLVIDCDVHQGDGTAEIFAGDASVFTLSLHAEKNYPVRKVASRLDVALADGTGDRAYSEA
ncbi:MAG: histone deacetylase, partial [Hyphomicrobiaceae bacterium]|nr:histone deacetylase [Hyphomicrobiaceae bacterium]